MPEPSFEGPLAVVAVAVLAPLAAARAPRLRVPAAVLEIVAGVGVGPSVLGVVEEDQVIAVLALPTSGRSSCCRCCSPRPRPAPPAGWDCRPASSPWSPSWCWSSPAPRACAGFVASGTRLDLRGLLEAPAALVRVPAYLLLLLLIRGVPTLVLVHWLGRRPALAVLVAAGPLSVLLFPPLAPAVLGPPVAGPASDR